MYKTLVTGLAGGALLASAAAAQTYSIGSNPQGSMAYAAAAAIAKVASEDAGLKTRVVPQGGPVVTLPLVNNGELDFSISMSVVAAFGVKGERMFKGRAQNNLRVAATLFPLRLGFFVRKDSGITSLTQLKGKRLGARFTKQKIVAVTSSAQLATVGLTYKDVIGVPVANGVRMVDDFIAGRIDAANWSLSSGATRKAHAAVGGIRVLSLRNTPEALAAMRKIAPGSIIETIQPGPRYPGVVGPTNTLTGAFVLMVSTKVPNDLVYKVVKALYSNKKKLVGVHKVYNDFEGKKMHLDIGMQFHAGALKFYREKGI
jgi:TRAP transporter TAXI family solute receptor